MSKMVVRGLPVVSNFMEYIVTVDERGRIGIPKLRGRLNLKEGSRADLEKDGRVSVDYIAGKEKVDLEEVEEALGFE